MTVNGEPVRFDLDPDTPLLWALRDAANLTGAKYGCDTGECGACTVIIDGRAQASCTQTIAALEGADVTTIEGLPGGTSHPVMQAWIAEQATQCGFCEPGLVLAVAALLESNPKPGEIEISAITNICRCGIGPRVRKVIERASQSLRRAESVRRNSSQFMNGSSDVSKQESDEITGP